MTRSIFHPRVALPISAFAVISVAAMLLAHQLGKMEHERLTQVVDGSAYHVHDRIVSELEYRISALRRMAARLDTSNYNRTLWEADARRYVRDFKDFQAVEWVDSSLHVRWIVPFEGNEAAQDLDLSRERRRAEALQVSRDTGRVSVSRPITLVQGELGFLVFVPLGAPSEFGGFVLGVYRVDDFFDHILDPETIAPGYSIRLFDAGSEMYSRGRWIEADASAATRILFDAWGGTWTLELAPSQQVAAQTLSLLPESVLIGGVLLGLALSMTIRMTLLAHNRARKVENVESVLERFFEVSADAFFVATPSGHIERINNAAQDMLGYASEELAGTLCMDLVHPDDLEKTVEEAEKLMRGTDCIHFENRCRRSDGSWCWVSWSSPSPGRSPQHLYASGRDITEQRMARVNLERRASFDPLTRLPNREYLRNRLARGLANADDAEASVCALFVDLDGFKRVNDAFGHDAGDRLLRQVAERLREVMRSGDIAARWGGDEFALFTADGGIEGAIRLAERIQTRLSDCYLHEGSQVSLSASIGIAMYTNDGESVQGLIARADAAMYASKQAGGNRYTLSENASTIDRQAPTDPANGATPATPV